MNLFAGEWEVSGPTVKGADVYRVHTGRVGRQWLSDCKEERVLTRRLLEEVADLRNLEQASRRVITNRGSPGIDGMTVKELKAWLSRHWRTLQAELLDGTYEPSLVQGTRIPKASGGSRLLGIPTVKDRLVQQAIHQVLSPRYERIFSAHSYGFRPQRSAHQALLQGGRHVETGHTWLVEVDLEKFFDTVNHNRTMWLLSRRIGDKRLLKLIHRFLQAGMLEGGLISQRVAGTPQGGPLSPLISNIILDELDKELERRGHRFVRYADDLRVFVRSEASAQRVMASMTRFIEGRMKLKVNQDKSKVCKNYETNFLGHGFLNDGRLFLSKESEARLKARVRAVTKRNRGISLNRVVAELNSALRGWLNYFRFAQMKGRIRALVGWIQRRLRCYRLKQCKRAIGIYRFMRKSGIPKRRSWLLAGSSKGWWRLAASPVSHEAMNRQWFNRIGLYHLFENYQRLKLEETAVYESTHGGVRGR
jgi:group II intron reverse transcriptase/maturase